MVDRSNLSRLLAKAIAYKLSGKQDEANAYAQVLVAALRAASILTDKDA